MSWRGWHRNEAKEEGVRRFGWSAGAGVPEPPAKGVGRPGETQERPDSARVDRLGLDDNGMRGRDRRISRKSVTIHAVARDDGPRLAYADG